MKECLVLLSLFFFIQNMDYFSFSLWNI